MTRTPLRIATRRSPLARWQAEHVAARLRDAHPGLPVELVGVTTEGDRILDQSLSKIGGKGLFVKALEQAMLEGRADVAVHSMKDVPADLPEGFELPCLLARDDPRDAFVSNRYPGPEDLPAGARVGTCSERRACQLRAGFPGVEIVALRGNVGTRLGRLDAGELDAVILAAAGLARLGLAARIARRLAPGQSLPAAGQGAIGIECRAGDARVRELLAPLDHPATHTRVHAERAMNRRLGGGCELPIGAYAELASDRLWLRGLVGEPGGERIIRGDRRGTAADAERLGIALAEELLARGAGEILRHLQAR